MCSHPFWVFLLQSSTSSRWTFFLLDFSSSRGVATSVWPTNRPHFRNFTRSNEVFWVLTHERYQTALNSSKRLQSTWDCPRDVLLSEKKMGRSGAAKNKKMRENRQELVQKILAGKIFYDMSWDGAFLWETLLSDKNGVDEILSIYM